MNAPIIAIIANGDIRDYAAARAKLSAADYFIACDGGVRHFAPLGLTPDCLLGDFDSTPQAELEKYTAQGIPTVPFPAQKNETDLALALAHARTLSPASIIIVGALGGRFDHTLGNVHALAGAGDIPTEIWDEKTSIQLIRPGVPAALPREEYTTLTLLPLGDSAAGITTRGLLYPLTGESLHAGETRGVSNAFTHDTAEITITLGLLTAIRSKT